MMATGGRCPAPRLSSETLGIALLTPTQPAASCRSGASSIRRSMVYPQDERDTHARMVLTALSRGRHGRSAKYRRLAAAPVSLSHRPPRRSITPAAAPTRCQGSHRCEKFVLLACSLTTAFLGIRKGSSQAPRPANCSLASSSPSVDEGGRHKWALQASGFSKTLSPSIANGCVLCTPLSGIESTAA
jgi:hypothetical protein